MILLSCVMSLPVRLPLASATEPARSKTLALPNCTSTDLSHVQARTQRLEAQIAATTSELHRLQAELRQLEARNALLETFAANEAGASEVIWVTIQAVSLIVAGPQDRKCGAWHAAAPCTLHSWHTHTTCML